MSIDMAKLRSVNTHFWHDDYIGNLLPHEKLLFLYLLTGPLCNIAGIYEISMRQMAFDTGLLPAEVGGIMQKFIGDGKVIYVCGYVILVNHYKNQKLNKNMETARLAIIKALPFAVKKAFESIPNPSEAFESVTESFVQVKDKDKDEVKVEEGKNAAATLAARQEAFKNDIFSEVNMARYGPQMLKAFFSYWSEETRAGKKMRMDLQPTWKLAGRLATWASKTFKDKPAGGRIYHEPR